MIPGAGAVGQLVAEDVQRVKIAGQECQNLIDTQYFQQLGKVVENRVQDTSFLWVVQLIDQFDVNHPLWKSTDWWVKDMIKIMKYLRNFKAWEKIMRKIHLGTQGTST